MPTYSNRYIETKTAATVGDSWSPNVVTDTDGWSAQAPDELVAILKPGDRYEMEQIGGPFGTIAGWRLNGRWYRRDSDEEIEAQRRKFIADTERRHREALEKNRAAWIGRTENLPGWLQDRIQTFRERGGERFELEGWGYELAVCELAALYDATDDGRTDSPEVNAYAHEHGTSGNQHDCARALVRHHREGNSLAGTVSALSPITGDAFYEGGAS